MWKYQNLFDKFSTIVAWVLIIPMIILWFYLLFTNFPAFLAYTIICIVFIGG